MELMSLFTRMTSQSAVGEKLPSSCFPRSKNVVLLSHARQTRALTRYALLVLPVGEEIVLAVKTARAPAVLAGRRVLVVVSLQFHHIYGDTNLVLNSNTL
jgi:hypothetical protein